MQVNCALSPLSQKIRSCFLAVYTPFIQNCYRRVSSNCSPVPLEILVCEEWPCRILNSSLITLDLRTQGNRPMGNVFSLETSLFRAQCLKINSRWHAVSCGLWILNNLYQGGPQVRSDLSFRVPVACQWSCAPRLFWSEAYSFIGEKKISAGVHGGMCM